MDNLMRDSMAENFKAYRPPRYALRFSWGEHEVELLIEEELSSTERDQAVKAWLDAVDKLVVR